MGWSIAGWVVIAITFGCSFALWVQGRFFPERIVLPSPRGDATLEVACRNYLPAYWIAGLGILLRIGVRLCEHFAQKTFEPTGFPGDHLIGNLFLLIPPCIGVFVLLFIVGFAVLLFPEDLLPWWVHRHYRITRSKGPDLIFWVSGGGWEGEKQFLWLPDGTGFLILSVRDVSAPIHLFRLPTASEVPDWNGGKFKWDPPGIDEEDYGHNHSFLKSVWVSYGYAPAAPLSPTPEDAPLASRHEEAVRMFEIFEPTSWRSPVGLLKDARKQWIEGHREFAIALCRVVLDHTKDLASQYTDARERARNMIRDIRDGVPPPKRSGWEYRITTIARWCAFAFNGVLFSVFLVGLVVSFLSGPWFVDPAQSMSSLAWAFLTIILLLDTVCFWEFGRVCGERLSSGGGRTNPWEKLICFSVWLGCPIFSTLIVLGEYADPVLAFNFALTWYLALLYPMREAMGKPARFPVLFFIRCARHLPRRAAEIFAEMLTEGRDTSKGPETARALLRNLLSALVFCGIAAIVVGFLIAIRHTGLVGQIAAYLFAPFVGLYAFYGPGASQVGQWGLASVLAVLDTFLLVSVIRSWLALRRTPPDDRSEVLETT